jgi:tungstate transport system ATP-binding protein
VALAARLILKPEVLLLDEPTASIDAASAQIIKDTTLMARNNWGTTLVIASHDWEWLYDICDHVVHLFRGRLFGSGRQNFIFGPWQQQPNGAWARELYDGQLLVVTKPPSDNAVAILDPQHLELTTSQKACTLSGMITRQLYDKDSQDILLVVQVANQAVTTRLSGDSIHKNGYYPGQTVKLYYQPEDITWY